MLAYTRLLKLSVQLAKVLDNTLTTTGLIYYPSNF